ncbi:MAG: DNA polymerase III subunit delta [Thermoguttaceae bacterium]
MKNLVSVHEYLWDSAAYPAKAICVVFGDDPFLKFHAVRNLRQSILHGEDAEFSLTRFDGNTAEMQNVYKELSTLSMFGGDRRAVIVEDADSFVTKNRDKLEQYAEKPQQKSVLILVLQSFPGNTRLYKRLAETGLLIEAKTLSEREMPSWVVKWSQHSNNVKCNKDAAALLVERVGAEHGILDQELDKLALIVPANGRITMEMVEKNVGSWRTQSVFAMLDAALMGDSAKAIRFLNQLFASGEDSTGILARIGSSLRKYGAATKLILDAEKNRKEISVSSALSRAGVGAYLEKAESQLKQIGRHRGAKLLDWLLQVDLDLKGGSSGNKEQLRHVLENFVIRLADPKLKSGI